MHVLRRLRTFSDVPAIVRTVRDGKEDKLRAERWRRRLRDATALRLILTHFGLGLRWICGQDAVGETDGSSTR